MSAHRLPTFPLCPFSNVGVLPFQQCWCVSLFEDVQQAGAAAPVLLTELGTAAFSGVHVM